MPPKPCSLLIRVMSRSISGFGRPNGLLEIDDFCIFWLNENMGLLDMVILFSKMDEGI